MYNFTTEDLLQFIYNELSAEKAAALTTALASDWTLKEKYEVLKSSQQQLDKVPMLSPRNATLDNIFKYAEKAFEELSEKV